MSFVITTMRITGMHCNNCIRHVDKALRGVAGVSTVEMNLADGLAKVTHDDGVELATLISAIESAGYKAAAATESTMSRSSPVAPITSK